MKTPRLTLPFLTADLPGIGGQVRQRLDDFRVEEIPLYEASGSGTHVYFRVLKAGIPTPAAVDRIARYMGVRPGEIGVAGLKDARAVTSQTLSLEHADPDKLKAFRDAQMQVISVDRHSNKLRPGHLAGNRFDIRIRGVEETALATARDVLDILVRRGVPNFFGPQRFGARCDTAVLGEALVRGDLEEFIAVLLGRAMPDDPPDCKAARDAFDAGFYNRALQCWPRHYSNERRVLSAYKKKKHCGPAMAAADKRMKRLYVSAYQSDIFNEILVRRLESIDRVTEGDLAQKTDSGGIFMVADPHIEQDRADRLEISPTGPIPGYRCHLAEGEPGKVEREILKAHHVELEDFRQLGPLKAKGTRRALRFAITEPSIEFSTDEHGPYLNLIFIAPSGCYATIVLREIMKDDA